MTLLWERMKKKEELRVALKFLAWTIASVVGQLPEIGNKGRIPGTRAGS